MATEAETAAGLRWFASLFILYVYRNKHLDASLIKLRQVCKNHY